MKRMHIHVGVKNLKESISFYSKMFATEPTIEKTDYAKWQLEDPKINFAISARGAAEGLNHLGIQVEDAAELSDMKSRLDTLQAELVEEEGTACCYAKSDKYWVNDPSGILGKHSTHWIQSQSSMSLLMQLKLPVLAACHQV
jgi:catechol 2,3-dioxygenase-like lactoylglutathione lyase family enzyme